MPTAELNTPPVVELVIGVQFSPLTKLTSGHYGRFWDEMGPDWDRTADQPSLEDRFEPFGQTEWLSPLQFRLEPVRLPGRFLLFHRGGDRLVQVQPTRFHLNWRRESQGYPSYLRLIAEFETAYARFAEFVERHALGPLLPNQWELTYINAFPQGDGWRTPADWPDVLPGLFGRLFSTDGLDLALERRTADWSFELTPRRGRLYLSASAGRWKTDDCLLLTATARGPVGDGAGRLRDGLDLGHAAALGAFERLVAADLLARRKEQV